MMDKLTALAVPPGNSLTDAPGKWQWEQPPQFPDPDDAIDHTVEMISNGPARKDMLKMMMAGITVEELVDQITFKGFMAGAISPDVAELIKPAIGVALIDMALKEGFEPQMFVEQEEMEGKFDDSSFFSTMQQRNPDLYAGMIEEMNEQTRMQQTEEEQEMQIIYPKENESQSFLDTPEGTQ